MPIRHCKQAYFNQVRETSALRVSNRDLREPGEQFMKRPVFHKAQDQTCTKKRTCSPFIITWFHQSSEQSPTYSSFNFPRSTDNEISVMYSSCNTHSRTLDSEAPNGVSSMVQHAKDGTNPQHDLFGTEICKKAKKQLNSCYRPPFSTVTTRLPLKAEVCYFRGSDNLISTRTFLRRPRRHIYSRHCLF